jgi:hypothetical protein
MAVPTSSSDSQGYWTALVADVYTSRPAKAPFIQRSQ